LKNVLIVDDDPLGRSSLEAVLTVLGFEVQTASSGLEALEIAKNSKLDFSVIDWMLGDNMNGVEVADALNLLHPNIRIVLISGHAEIESQQLNGKPYSYLTKPFHVQQLLGFFEL